MPDKYDRPRPREAVNITYANGIRVNYTIIDVSYSTQEVILQNRDKTEVLTKDFSELEDKWTHKFGGVYLLEE